MITAKETANSITTPGQANWRADDPRTNLDAKLADDVARLDMWFDAGIRDFFNAQVSTNSLMGALGAKGAPCARVGRLPRHRRRGAANENAFDANHVDWPTLGRHVYVRYGNPDLSEADRRGLGRRPPRRHRARRRCTARSRSCSTSPTAGPTATARCQGRQRQLDDHGHVHVVDGAHVAVRR